MPILTADEIAIRMATERAVQAAGGGKHAAAALGTDESKISRLQNTSNETSCQAARVYLKACEVVKLDRIAGAPILLEELCRLEGRTLAPKCETGIASEGMSNHSAAILKEVAEAIGDMANAIRRDPSPALAKRIHDNLQDVIDRSKDAQAECMRAITASAPRLATVS